MTEDTQSILNLEIGTKEPVTLKPCKVIVTGAKIKENIKNNKVTSRLIVLLCKHPDSQKDLEISNVKRLKAVGKDEKVTLDALWYNLDEDGKLEKRSAAAELLRFYGVEKFGELIGKEIDTIHKSDMDTFLCIRAY